MITLHKHTRNFVGLNGRQLPHRDMIDRIERQSHGTDHLNLRIQIYNQRWQEDRIAIQCEKTSKAYSFFIFN